MFKHFYGDDNIKALLEILMIKHRHIARENLKVGNATLPGGRVDKLLLGWRVGKGFYLGK